MSMTFDHDTTLPGRIARPFRPLTNALNCAAPHALPLMARVIFAATLARFFWVSALTKIDGFGLSANAYIQILPKAMEAVGYNPSALPGWATPLVLAGTLAEFILPALIILGAFTRLSAFAMIGFIVVMSLTDILGHGVATGALFDKDPLSLIADQRLYWVGMLAVPVMLGGGWLSLDRLIFAQRAG